MTPSLFRAGTVPGVGETIVLDGPEGRHAGSALRVRVGEAIRVGDGRGAVADCVVTTTSPGRVEAEVVSRVDVPRPTPEVTVVQALPKSERSELAVELATEAGADRIVPWQADRCVSRWTGPKVDKGRTKWTNAARAAAKQSRRAWEPQIGDLVDSTALAALVASEVDAGARVLVLHEDGAAGFADAVAAGPPAARVLVVVGPEGGVSDAELDALTAAGARPVVLGPEVLRTSTAATVALAALGVLTPRWSAAGSTLDPTSPRHGK
ncbi:16S rRNA (uracil(1498)-N(3))-methyltransferase [Dietzia sp. B32]|uniref:16S rRNA (uracil(1498)-N(3))-methyltransferase n=1 Tax=Dietzia sp. B32 TaxID=2915130 RepID=UPI0021ADCDF9|nr:16S rRNA (uracil(1498)-N(3))-methyltransferase [Dietzia sp. B32]UVE94673.1 16S rRNA (uracil(1498)-N(3))-methyltransferase [Dietzia sp. B32]